MRISPTIGDRAHYVHKNGNSSQAFVNTMCKYVAILVYQGLIEDVGVFDAKEEAARWLSDNAEEYGADNCADSIIWDARQKSPIHLAFVSH